MRYSITGSTQQEVQQHGGKNISVKHNLNMIFADMNKNQVDNLSTQPGVTVTEVKPIYALIGVPVPIAAAAGDSTTPEALIDNTELDSFRRSFSPPLLGTDINIAVIDTGVRVSHKSLEGKVILSENFSTSTTTNDVFNHGTGVAHIVHVTAPDSNILNLKAINDDGVSSEEAITNAIERCIEMKVQNHQYAPHIINLSLGGVDDGNPNNALRVACRTAIDNFNIWIAAAAGNNGPASGTIASPACEKYVLAVGSASFPENILDTFSSRGPTKEGLIKPDVLMVGSNVLMASSTSDIAEIAKSGTSFSTPFLCGLAAWFWQGSKDNVIRDRYKELVFAKYSSRYYAGGVSYDPTMQQIIDEYMPGVSLKPGDVLTTDYTPIKDNDSGYGTFCGTMAIAFLSGKAYSAAVQLVVSNIVQILLSVVILQMMFKMIIKQIAK